MDAIGYPAGEPKVLIGQLVKLIGVCKLAPEPVSEDFSFLLQKPEAMAA